MNTKEHALLEFRACGWLKDGVWCDELQELMCKQVLELLELFASHGHSGSTAPYAISLFTTLAKQEPFKPLTGEDWEWSEYADGKFQNKRCYHVFKNEDGKAYDVEGKIFREQNGCCYTSRESLVYIEFPYTPKPEYVDVPESEV